MDKITEKWKDFLKKKNNSYQIYCDMDGVLVDLEAGIEEELVFADIEDDIREQAIRVIHSGELWHTLQGDSDLNKGVKAIFDVLSQGSSEKRKEFWADLPPKSDVMTLWNYISEYNPIILSAPWKINDKIDQACCAGKKKWFEKLNPQPRKVIIAGCEGENEGDTSKHLYARNEDGTKNILIDDMEFYLNDWDAAGGIAIKHTSASTTIKELEKWLK